MLSKVRIKYIQSLGQKKDRDAEDVFIAEGPKIVEEFLSSANVEIQHLYATGRWIEKNRKRIESVELTEVEPSELERISQLKTPNEVLAVVSKFKLPATIDLKSRVTLALDTIQDPGNMGTIIRIADWFGVKNIICSNDCADSYSSKVVQSTMGSIARVNIIYTELESWLKKDTDVKKYAAALSGRPLRSFGKIEEGILIVGNESKGIHENILAMADEKITIQRIGKAESLNAAVSTGIILSHIAAD
jgi:RNA methyltransferase, TrmH family